jgi:hypothetical protein
MIGELSPVDAVRLAAADVRSIVGDDTAASRTP